MEISGPAFIVTGTDDEELEASRAGVKQQIAFYGSTPAYRPVLELHGWGDLQGELNKRYGDVVSRLSFYAPYASDPERWRAVMEQLHAV